MLEVRKCTISELENNPNFAGLVGEYAVESAISGLPHPSGKMVLYKVLETSGVLYASAAYFDARLIGFLVVLSSVNPHYGVCLSTTESLFVGREYRKTGAGLKLIRDAERVSREVGSPGLLISAPMGGDLAEVLPRIGYEETNRTFFKNPTGGKLAVSENRIPAMSEAAIAKVYRLEDFAKKMPQVDIETSHAIHGGMYARTIIVPAGVMLTGALVKIATTLIINGDVVMYIDGEAKELHGYHVFAASANRKQAFVAQTDTYITMIFPTNAKTVEEAEEQFTDEAHLLFSRNSDARNSMVTEEKCLAG